MNQIGSKTAQIRVAGELLSPELLLTLNPDSILTHLLEKLSDFKPERLVMKRDFSEILIRRESSPFRGQSKTWTHEFEGTSVQFELAAVEPASRKNYFETTWKEATADSTNWKIWQSDSYMQRKILLEKLIDSKKNKKSESPQKKKKKEAKKTTTPTSSHDESQDEKELATTDVDEPLSPQKAEEGPVKPENLPITLPSERPQDRILKDVIVLLTKQYRQFTEEIKKELHSGFEALKPKAKTKKPCHDKLEGKSSKSKKVKKI
jgi:hypothetical protein